MRYLRDLWKLFEKDMKKTAAFMALLAAVKAAVPLAMLFVLRELIDGVTSRAGAAHIAGSFLLYVLLVFAGALASHLDARAQLALEEQIELGFLPKILEAAGAAEYACFETSEFQDVLSRVKTGGKENLLNFIKSGASVLTSLLLVAGLFFYYFSLSATFAFGFVLLLCLTACLDYKSIRTMNAMIEGQTPEERQMEYLESVLKDKDALAELQVFRAAPHLAEKWHGIAGAVLGKRFRKAVRTQRYFLGSSLCLVLWIAGLAGVTIYRTVGGYVTIGTAVSALRSISTVLDAAESFSFQIYQALESLARLKSFSLLQNFPKEKPSGKELPQGDGPFEIVFDHVGFTYPGARRPVFEDLTLTFNTGQRTALVGENGCGKTTLVKLLCGLYRPDRGRILIGGADMRELGRESLSRFYSVVFQDFVRYSFSLRENLTLGCGEEKWTDEELRWFLKKCNFHKDVSLDTALGKLQEDGADLSGGEWQKVAIARALAHGGAYLILDEPTAALDPMAESVLYQDFLGAMEGRGCVLISHRLASARLCDRIVVLQGGAVAEEGSHEELMAKKGYYCRMYEAQQSWYQ